MPLHGDAQGDQRNLTYRNQALTPAFCDLRTGTIYPSIDLKGAPAALHLLSSLPSSLVIVDASGRPTRPVPKVEVGYERDGKFYTRDEAAQLTNALDNN